MVDKKQQLSIAQLPRPIQKIIKELENTDLKFYKGYLKNWEKNEYCLVGAICNIAGVKDDLLIDQCLIADTDHSIEIDLSISDLIGTSMTCDYLNVIEYCPLCDEAQGFTDLESVLNHLNDDHNKKETHKENARLIVEFSKHYDLITGKEVQSKLG